MKIYVTPPTRRETTHIEYPCVFLAKNDWDDYGHKTTYDLTYYDEPNHEEFSHQVKILNSLTEVTSISDADLADGLAPNYCSLGQSLDYYRDMQRLSSADRDAILSSLNDVVFNQQIGDDFKELKSFKTSLLRFSDAEKAFLEGKTLLFPYLYYESTLTPHFEFSCYLKGAAANHRIDFDFRPRVPGLSRIIALIGRNGTGKTQLLANLANALSGWEPTAGTFEPTRPRFSKIIAISYSVFDKFDRPSDELNTFSYKYCGVLENDRILSLDDLKKT